MTIAPTLPAASFLGDAATFIYQTPAWIVASTVTGIALLILLPHYSVPFLAFSGSAVLMRLAVKIVDIYDNKFLMKTEERLLLVEKKYFYVQYIAFAISILITFVLPIAGLIGGISLGLYKGIIVELEIFKYRQQVRRIELKQPIKKERVKIINC